MANFNDADELAWKVFAISAAGTVAFIAVVFIFVL
jgi:hypothetical protein